MQKERPKADAIAGRQAAKPAHLLIRDPAAHRFLEGIFRDPGLGKLKKAIRNDLDPNDRFEHGRTPLMYAAFWDRPDACRFLIRKGARIDAKDENGDTAYSLAKELGNANVCDVIIAESTRMLAKMSGRKATDAALKAIESVK
jgi:ankyrin repeat protein